tara:strand:+ start:490 stop:666 length:177 start_codon:yes stop_codon:yes gene_type:complete
MDYKELLKKYIQLIISEESVNYLSNCNSSWGSDAPEFTEDEIKELKSIAKEVDEKLGF